MRIIADLHIHSKYSGATSQRMNIPEIASFAQLKGLNLLGTGDALHPSWLKELKRDLEPIDETGFYKPKMGGEVYFVAQTEVATVHQYMGKARRIHHVILMPSFEVAEQLSDRLSKFGNISADGRPVLNMSPSELVEIVIEFDWRNLIFPAHIWTPWWSMLGARGGVDSLEECYEDQAKHIYAIETGLSSDPPMNWRVSWLNNLTILSSSDSHSPYPYRLGREAVILDLRKPNYMELYEAIVWGDQESKVLMTIEVPPAYGKYHWSGHRNCNFGPIPPEEARKLNYKCPVCGRTLTKGVDDRVEELADKPRGYRPKNAKDFIHLIPLQEIIAHSLGMGGGGEARLNSKRIWSIYDKLVNKFGTEFKVLLDADPKEVAKLSNPSVADLIIKMRTGRLRIIPGYDGVYGRIVSEEEYNRLLGRKYSHLEDYI